MPTHSVVQGHVSLCSFLLCSYSLYQQAFTMYYYVHFFPIPLQLPHEGCHHVLLGLCQLPPDWYLCCHHDSPCPLSHLPHCSQNDSIKNVYQAPVHLKQASGNDGLLAKSVLPPVFIWTLRIQSLSREDLLEEGMQPTPVFSPEKSHGQRSLEGYSPWGHKESAMTQAI